jgi:polysaccharide export outer membrane protein
MTGTVHTKYKKIFLVVFVLAGWLLSLPLAAFASDYIIGDGDTLAISVWGEKELTVIVKVRPDGKITIPAIGELTAANVSVQDLQVLLTGKLSRIVKNPVVTVMVTEITNNKVYLFGGGINSGIYSLNQRTTLLQLLCMVGQQQSAGPQAAPSAPSAGSSSVRYADLKNAYVMRKGKKIKQNFHNLFINGSLADDIVIEPNDAIFIPALLDRNIYVMGAVMTPRAIEYRDGLTVMGAILESGGFTKFADQNDTIIYRNDGSKYTAIPVKMKKLMHSGDLSQNLLLQAGDYIMVKEGIF